jgi:hypothetical protein
MPERRMTKEEAKAAFERSVFRDFAEAARLPLVRGSIESRPPPEPDILCTVEGGTRVAFELVCLVDQDLAHVTAQAIANPAEPRGVWFDDPTFERIREKLVAKEYKTVHPMELLAWGDDTLLPRSSWEPMFADQVRALFDSTPSRFRRLWVANLDSSQRPIRFGLSILGWSQRRLRQAVREELALGLRAGDAIPGLSPPNSSPEAQRTEVPEPRAVPGAADDRASGLLAVAGSRFAAGARKLVENRLGRGRRAMAALAGRHPLGARARAAPSSPRYGDTWDTQTHWRSRYVGYRLWAYPPEPRGQRGPIPVGTASYLPYNGLKWQRACMRPPFILAGLLS